MKRLPISLSLLLAIGLQIQGFSQSARIAGKSFWQNGKSQGGKPTMGKVGRFACLPEGRQLTDVISYQKTQKANLQAVTIKDKLLALKARCKAGKLIDGKSREIKFFNISCFGNAPDNYEEIVQKERQELAKLQKSHTVILIECNPHIQ
jgi:hypothetical protein